MKHLLSFSIAIMVSLVLFAQDEELRNFKVEGNGITWQKTYPTVLSIDQVKAKFDGINAFESSEASGMMVRGKSIAIENDYVEQGFSEKTAEKYIVQKDCTGELTVEFQEGKYRVTLKDIYLKQRFSTKKSPRGDLRRLSDYAYDAKKQQWNPDFLKKGSARIINQTLLKMFDVQGKFDGSDF